MAPPLWCHSRDCEARPRRRHNSLAVSHPDAALLPGPIHSSRTADETRSPSTARFKLQGRLVDATPNEPFVCQRHSTFCVPLASWVVGHSSTPVVVAIDLPGVESERESSLRNKRPGLSGRPPCKGVAIGDRHELKRILKSARSRCARTHQIVSNFICLPIAGTPKVSKPVRPRLLTALGILRKRAQAATRSSDPPRVCRSVFDAPTPQRRRVPQIN